MKTDEPKTKKLVAFRFSQRHIQALKKTARRDRKTKTRVLEDWIDVHGAQVLKEQP